MSKLKPNVQRFVDEYVVDLNGAQAAIRAGYSANGARQQAARLLTNVDVRNAIATRQRELQQETGLTQAQVLEDIKRLAMKAEAAEEYSPALKARELLGKHLGMWREKIELTGANGGPVQSVAMSPAEAKAIAEGLASKI